jgi:membrane associated rhomboid family serine protease
MLLLFAVPVIALIVIFVTTDPATFEYKVANPELWGIYLSNLSHRSWMHLGGNLLVFIFIGFLEYILLTPAGYRTHYISMFLLVLLIAPLFSHFFLQYVLDQQPVFHTYEAVGFSESIAAMTAYLPLALTTYCRRVSGIRWPYLTALLLYTGGLALATTRLFGTNFATPLFSAFGILGVTIIMGHVCRTSTVSRKERRQYFLTSLFALLAFTTALVGLFGTQNVGTLVGHFAGFLPGFFLPFAILWGVKIAAPARGFGLPRG